MLALAACAEASLPSGPDATPSSVASGDADPLTDGRDAGPGSSPDAGSGCTARWHPDADGDGYGDATVATTACERPAGHVSDGTDCDDSTGWRHPGLAEYCDGIDNDCDAATGEICSSECKPRSYGGHVYIFCDGDTDFASAAGVCATQRMRLVKIDDAAENEGERTTAHAAHGSSVDFWIGANDRATEDSWTWPDDTPFWRGRSSGSRVGGAYANWDPGEPNDDGTEDCAEMQSDGQWNDVPCRTVQEFVCERW